MKTITSPSMNRRSMVLSAAAAGASAVFGTGEVLAQTQSAAAWPNRTVKLVVPFPPGGATDLVGRLLAGKLAEAWGQPVVVENRAGASGMIGTEQVAKSPPDGYSLVVAITTHIQNPSIFAKVPFDPIKDFEPISQICLSYLVLAVKPEFPANNIREFVAHAKANLGKLNFGSFGTGSSSHIVGERFSRIAGLQMTHVPYKGSGPMVTDLLGGQVDTAWIDVSTATPHLNAGKLKPLVVTGPTRAPMLPNVQTLAENGYSGFEPLGWVGLLAPAGTPKPIIEKISRDIMRIVRLPDVTARLNEQTLVPVGNSPEAFAKVLKDDGATWAQIISGAGITPQ